MKEKSYGFGFGMTYRWIKTDGLLHIWVKSFEAVNSTADFSYKPDQTHLNQSDKDYFTTS